MAAPKARVGIVGAGPAGLATAAFLSRNPTLEIWLFDKRSQPETMGGYSISLMQSGAESLRELGLLEAATQAGFKSCFRTLNSTYEMHVQQPPQPFSRVDRASLLSLISESVPISVVRKYSLGPLMEISKAGNKQLLIFGSGTYEVDIIIGADGVGSFVRRAMGLPTSIRSYGVVAVRGVLVKTSHTRGLEEHSLKPFEMGFQIHDTKTNSRFLVVPQAADKLYWLFTYRGHLQESDRAEVKALLARSLSGYDRDAVCQTIATVTDTSTITAFNMVDVDPLAGEELIQRRDKSSILGTLVGDAAHPMLNFTGGGLNAALADACKLYSVLKSGLNTGSAEELKAAFAQYEDEMIPRAATIALIARKMLRDFHKN